MCSMLLQQVQNIYPSIRNFGVISEKANIGNIPASLSKHSTSLMTIHLFSSRPMGENKKLCSVDSYGKLFGFKTFILMMAV